jgi:hypothetical protein
MPAHIESIVVEPIHVAIGQAPALVGESRTELYDAIRRGELTAVKKGHRTFLVWAELKARCAARPVVKRLKENPHLAAARDAYHAKRKAARKRKGASR